MKVCGIVFRSVSDWHGGRKEVNEKKRMLSLLKEGPVNKEGLNSEDLHNEECLPTQDCITLDEISLELKKKHPRLDVESPQSEDGASAQSSPGMTPFSLSPEESTSEADPDEIDRD